MKKLEYSPRSPFHDIEETVAKLRAAHPGISDFGVSQAIKRMLTGYKGRHKGLVVHLFGEDILTADLTQIPAWADIGNGERQRLREHPYDTGERIANDVEGPVRLMLQEELKGRLNRRAINRSVLISPPGLKQTYVWRQSNGWIQEVMDADYDLILSTPSNRRRFRDPDIHGPYNAVRSYYNGEAQDRHIARNLRDADYLIRQTQRRPQWSGADVGDD